MSKKLSLDEADKVLQCAAAVPKVRREVTLKNVQAWIRAKGKEAMLLDFQISKYLCDVEVILVPPDRTLSFPPMAIPPSAPVRKRSRRFKSPLSKLERGLRGEVS
jgi:hypothetical protein